MLLRKKQQPMLPEKVGNVMRNTWYHLERSSFCDVITHDSDVQESQVYKHTLYSPLLVADASVEGAFLLRTLFTHTTKMLLTVQPLDDVLKPGSRFCPFSKFFTLKIHLFQKVVPGRAVFWMDHIYVVTFVVKYWN